MDDHFVLPVFKDVEEVNDYFRDKLYSLLRHEAGIDLRLGLGDLCDR
jgi:hypothetical protein